jgi:nitronate monooxygenase
MNVFARMLDIRYPIIQAPMAGGATTVDLVVEVSKAGALGSLGAAYSTPDVIAGTIRAIKARTDRPFSVNLFAPQREPEEFDATPMVERLTAYHLELGLPPPSIPAPALSAQEAFERQVDAVIESGAPVFTFTFGIPSSATLRRFKGKGVMVIGTATTVEEAIALELAGVDAIVAQGSEAGGHRGTFNGPFEAALIGTMALVPQMVDAVSIPVIASGGIMDGRGIVAAQALGASAAQLGTAFLTTDESGIAEAYKTLLLSAREDETAITRAFSGRHARGIVNRAMREIDAAAYEIPPYPIQNALTRPMRTAAASAGKTEYLSLFAGQAPRLARRLPAGELVRRLVDEAASVRESLREVGAV